MTPRSIALVLLSTLMAAHAAMAQTQGTGGDTAATTAVSSQAPAPVPALANTKARADADARACLEFVSNIGVIRCAEKYRSHGGAKERRDKG